jgi:Putative zinc-finger domain
MAHAVKEMIWLQYLLRDLGMSKYAPTTLFRHTIAISSQYDANGGRCNDEKCPNLRDLEIVRFWGWALNELFILKNNYVPVRRMVQVAQLIHRVKSSDRNVISERPVILAD